MKTHSVKIRLFLLSISLFDVNNNEPMNNKEVNKISNIK